MNLDNFLERLDGVETTGKGYTALCPAHNDNRNSLSVGEGNNGGIVIKCHASCTNEAVCAALNLTLADLMPPKATTKQPARAQIAENYDYTDEAGKLLYQAVRKIPKAFTQRQPEPDGKGGWVWNLAGVQRVPYRLPKVIEAVASGVTVWIVEGEKDVHALEALGLTATTNAGGAGKWQSEWSHFFADAQVVILPDNDEAGRNHAQEVARYLHPVAASVRVVQLADLPLKGDVSDWLKKGGTPDQLREMAKQASVWEVGQGAVTRTLDSHTAPTPIFRNSDTGNVDRFLHRHGAKLRYDHSRKSWFVWTGKRWERDNVGQAQELAKETVLSIYAEVAATAGDERRESLGKWAAKSDDRARIAAILTLALSDKRVSMEGTEWDTDIWAFNCQNGTIDLRNGCLKPHSPADLLTKISPVDYDPEAVAPLWSKCLERWQPNTDVRGFLQRAAGYSLTGHTGEETLLFFYGNGRNGKGKFTGALEFVLGSYATRLRADVLMVSKRDTEGNTPELADLEGARMVLVSEIEEGHRLREGLVKDLTGGDVIKVMAKYEKPRQFKPTFKPWLVGNHKPRLTAVDDGIKSRVPLIPFGVFIPPAERDFDLDKKLQAEGAGILAWAVRGCLLWRKNRLSPPKSVIEATEAYHDEQDVFGRFLRDVCKVSESEDDWTPTAVLQQAFNSFAGYGIAEARLGERLRGIGSKDYTRVHIALNGGDGKRKRGWSKISLLQDTDTPTHTDTPNTGKFPIDALKKVPENTVPVCVGVSLKWFQVVLQDTNQWQVIASVEGGGKFDGVGTTKDDALTALVKKSETQPPSVRNAIHEAIDRDYDAESGGS